VVWQSQRGQVTIKTMLSSKNRVCLSSLQALPGSYSSLRNPSPASDSSFNVQQWPSSDSKAHGLCIDGVDSSTIPPRQLQEPGSTDEQVAEILTRSAGSRMAVVKRGRRRTIFFCQETFTTRPFQLRTMDGHLLVKDQDSPQISKSCKIALEIQEWTRGSIIGQGSYGQVFKALETSRGAVFAVKQAQVVLGDDSERRYIQKLAAELSIVSGLRHPHIVSYLGYELKEFGPLCDSLLKNTIHGTLKGLDYLHSREPPVVHRDIKCANILVDLDTKVKLADFGCSKQSTVSTSFTSVGSIPWMAPEVILQQHGYGRKADIWSFGCTNIEMATAELPWGRDAFDNTMFALRKIAMSDEIPPIPQTCDSNIRCLLSSCFIRKAEQRSDASSLLRKYFC
jgi:hypothetical protein